MDIRSSFGFCRGYHVPKRVTTHPQRLLRPVHYNVPKSELTMFQRKVVRVVAMSLKVMMDVVEWVAPPPVLENVTKDAREFQIFLKHQDARTVLFIGGQHAQIQPPKTSTIHEWHLAPMVRKSGIYPIGHKNLLYVQPKWTEAFRHSWSYCWISL